MSLVVVLNWMKAVEPCAILTVDNEAATQLLHMNNTFLTRIVVCEGMLKQDFIYHELYLLCIKSTDTVPLQSLFCFLVRLDCLRRL